MKRMLLSLMMSFCCIISQTQTIRVAHYNMGQLSMGKKEHSVITEKKRERILDKHLKLLARIDADILCLCEFADIFSLNADSTLNTADPTKKVLLKDYHYFLQGKKVGKRRNIIASKTIPLLSKDCIYFTVNNKKSRLYYLVTEIRIGEQNVKIIETHLDIPNYNEKRECEIKELIENFKDEKYVIICGDFNVAKTTEYNAFREAGYVLANHGEFGDMITHPWKNGGGTCIDNIMCKGFDIEMIQLYNANLSDHAAISCDLTIKYKQYKKNRYKK